MTRSITLDAAQRRALIERYRKDPDPEVRSRAHILLLLDDGHSWATVATLLFCSSRTIDRWVKRFLREGLEGLAGHKPGRPFHLAARWIAVVVEWVTTQAPRDFGFLRSRWCCEAVAILMLELHQVEVSRETVRRWLHRGNLVYRRPRPTLKRPDATTYLSGGCHNLPITDICTTADLDRISSHRQSRWYEEGPLKGPSVEAPLALVPILVEVRSLTEGPLAPGVLSSHSLGVHFTWDRLGPSGHGRPHVPRCLPRWGPSRSTPGTAEPVGVSPPEAVDSIGLRKCSCLNYSKNSTLRADLHLELMRLDMIVVCHGFVSCRTGLFSTDRSSLSRPGPIPSRSHPASTPRNGPVSAGASTCTAPSPGTGTSDWSAPHGCWSAPDG